MKSGILNYRTNCTDLNCSVSHNFDSLSREDKILSHTPLVNSIACKLARQLPPNILPGDLIGAGVIGLIDAVNKFGSQKNVEFKVYARYRIEGAMWDELRALDWVPRSIRKKKVLYTKAYQHLQNKRGEPARDEEIARELGLPLSEFYTLINEINFSFLDAETLEQGGLQSQGKDSVEYILGKQEDPFYLVSHREQRKALARVIETLSQKEKLVISLYCYEGLNLKRIGEILSLTEGRVSQIRRKAIMNLKVKLMKTGFIH